jgi:hypothetical protein
LVIIAQNGALQPQPSRLQGIFVGQVPALLTVDNMGYQPGVSLHQGIQAVSASGLRLPEQGGLGWLSEATFFYILCHPAPPVFLEMPD